MTLLYELLYAKRLIDLDRLDSSPSHALQASYDPKRPLRRASPTRLLEYAASRPRRPLPLRPKLPHNLDVVGLLD